MIEKVIFGVSYLVGYEESDRGLDPSALFSPSPEREAELAAMPYSMYLRTPEWKEKRRIEFNAASYRCSRCSSQGPLELHHKTYERRGREQPDDLEVLCGKCHRSHHGIAA